MSLFYHHIKKKKVSLMTAVLGLLDLFRLNFLIQVQGEGQEIILSGKDNGKLRDKVFPPSVYKYCTQ